MRPAALLAALAVALPPGAADAFSIGSCVTKWCHETMTRDAIAASNVRKPAGWLREWPDQDESWLKVARWLEEEGFIEAKDDRYRLLQVSLFLGSRYPDQGGFGATDLRGLREIHLSARDQVEHCLRNPEHDGEEGDRLALEATRARIRDLVRRARAPLDTWSMSGQMTTVSVWLEFYGAVDVVVWEPAFLMGQALHVLQDSFSHTYRSADLRRVYAVCNYLDAVRGGYDEARDGPRHSRVFDGCDEEEVRPLEQAAIRASTDLFNAGLVYLDTDDLTEVDRVLDEWLTLEPGCGYAAGYCDTPWAALARRDETKPLGCSAAGGGGCLELLAALALAALGLRSRRGGGRG